MLGFPAFFLINKRISFFLLLFSDNLFLLEHTRGNFITARTYTSRILYCEIFMEMPGFQYRFRRHKNVFLHTRDLSGWDFLVTYSGDII